MNAVSKNWLSLRYKPRRRRFAGCKPCPSFKIFDWVIWRPDSFWQTTTRSGQPKRILCLPTRQSIKLLTRKISHVSNAVVVFAGEDTHLSALIESIEPLLPKFNRVYFEAKDIKHCSIKSFSMGFISYYLRDCGEENIRAAVDFADEHSDEKNGVMAAWGKQWPELDDRIADRKNAELFLNQCDFLDRKMFAPQEYWGQLARHRFCIAPAGQGIQSPKLAEAWMVKTIPIVTRNPCFEDLAELGFPLAIVENWEEITVEKISQWQQEFESVDWNMVRSMLTIDHFQHKLESNS